MRHPVQNESCWVQLWTQHQPLLLLLETEGGLGFSPDPSNASRGCEQSKGRHEELHSLAQWNGNHLPGCSSSSWKSPSQNREHHHCSMAQVEAWFRLSGSSPGLPPDPSVLCETLWLLHPVLITQLHAGSSPHKNGKQLVHSCLRVPT